MLLTSLLDNGLHLVLIDDTTVHCLRLCHFRLETLEYIDLTMKLNGPKVRQELTEWVWLELFDPSLSWKTRKV
jgi:hypothetical protein